MDDNLILHLPFDDPDGLNKVYDYSTNRNDGTLSGSAFLTRHAQKGKALDINGDGECVVPRNIPFNSNFTLSFWAKTTSNKIGWLINMPGTNNYREKWINVLPGEWNFFALVKDGKKISVFFNQKLDESMMLPDNPIGISINDEFISGCYSSIDDVRLFDVAKNTAEVLKMQYDKNDVEYFVNGLNFKDFGVYVSNSTGLVGMLERKEALTVEWDNYHGIVRDKKRPRYKERTISLDCFIEASSRSAYVEWVNLFLSQFDKEGTQRLSVEYDGNTKPLVYEVVALNDVDPDKKWGTYNDELMVGTFKLRLTEDEPVKRVLRHIGSDNSTAQITVTTSKLLNIYWGDGTHTFDVSGTDKEVSHKYEKRGEYDIVITGVIEDIEEFSTNAIIIWNKLS
ncbi:MAG TPA: hypothetical protein DDW85_01595 [Porphyromonadaceae bacterium]|nr:hypothetical protein [Porphyromonadaceae bacterium]